MVEYQSLGSDAGLFYLREPAPPQLNSCCKSPPCSWVSSPALPRQRAGEIHGGGLLLMGIRRIFFKDSRKHFWGRERPGLVYLMHRGDGKFKIGCVSGNVEWRRDTLSAGCGDLKILHTFPAKDRYTAERLLHRYLHRLRIKGEWYALPDDVVEWIKRIEGFVGEYPFQECDCGLLVREAEA